MSAISKLLDVMRQLRDPQGGCPWDLAQNFKSVAPYTLEEAYEVTDAISRDDLAGLREELGDLLFQVVFHAQMATELGAFTFDDVVVAITDKMTRRHPHVFADAVIGSVAEQSLAWEELKARERALTNSAASGPMNGLMDGLPANLPAIAQAEKLQRRASRIGLDWTQTSDVLARLREELDELEQAIQTSAAQDRQEDELGDVLFSCINLARHLGFGAENTLRRASCKFASRVRSMERLAADSGDSLSQLGEQELEHLWVTAKMLE